jgi:hypothetical protein
MATAAQLKIIRKRAGIGEFAKPKTRSAPSVKGATQLVNNSRMASYNIGLDKSEMKYLLLEGAQR